MPSAPQCRSTVRPSRLGSQAGDLSPPALDGTSPCSRSGAGAHGGTTRRTLRGPACRPSLHTLTGHTESLHALAVAPDGLWLASGSADQSLRIWSPTDGTFVSTIRTEATIDQIRWSPDSTTIFCAGARTVYGFDLLR
ncbi:WD40 repeat domain-containing protein [Phytohabitans flavus]|uniref:WD40 repeat domain-containing protein n=1 Tax=Phytohabitans flavus TaxID=1076124 RepID=UPI00363D6BC4